MQSLSFRLPELMRLMAASGDGSCPGDLRRIRVAAKSAARSHPEDLPPSRAILAEPLANIVHLFRLAAPPPLFRLAIVGAGTMGALTLLLAKRIGARDVLIADINAERLQVMQQFGAQAIANVSTPEGKSQTMSSDAIGFDLVIDASGSAPARQFALDLCRPGGQVVLLGMGSQRSELDFVTSIRKEHRVTMSFAYTPVDFNRSVQLLIAGEIDLDSSTENLPLERGQLAFEKMTKSPGPILKMVQAVS
jgi:threonine dehydrogenase-like Zn-dependent dehydrogenase